MSRTSTYTSWEQMIRRCYNEKFPDFGNYGGRGIRVCDLWRWSFIEFFRDMGTAPKGYSIDRIDNDGNYYPMNCRWADRKTQCRNTRRNKKICFNGEERNLIDWAEIFGLEWYVLWGRLKLGWPVERALMEPVKKWKNRRKINA